MNNAIKYIKAILIPVIVGAVIGFITSNFIDYNTLKQPFLAPPAIAFPIVWTILYVLMGVSYGILDSNNLVDSDINWFYYVQLAVNALWSIFFFVLKWRLFSFFWIILLVILVITMIVRFYNKKQIAGILQIPYLLWLLFASYLNISIYLLNR